MKHSAVLLLAFLVLPCFAQKQQIAVTVVSAESTKVATGYESTNTVGGCTNNRISDCHATSVTSRTKIPVRFLYTVIDGHNIRLQAKQKFLTSYGKTLPPGDYQGEWKNSHTLTIHYTEEDKPKTADYELAGVWQ